MSFLTTDAKVGQPGWHRRHRGSVLLPVAALSAVAGYAAGKATHSHAESGQSKAEEIAAAKHEGAVQQAQADQVAEIKQELAELKEQKK